MAYFKKYRLRALCLFVLATVLAWGYLTFQDIGKKSTSPISESDPAYDSELSGYQMSTPGSMGAIDRTFEAVSDSELPDDAVIIALEINGVHYAYPKLRLSDIGAHVATEILGDIPIAVTYCNETECVRVFTGDTGGPRLDVTQEGLDKGKFLILVDGKPWFQDDESIPLQDYAFELVSWNQWKTEHPNGLVLAVYEWE
jgi:hypothetical protein